MSKTVLFIAYEFPPGGGPAVQRPAKFVKHLPEFGWEAVVITTTPDMYAVTDETLMADIPTGAPIYRTRSYDINVLRPRCERLHLGKVLSAINAALLLPDAGLPWSLLARSRARAAVEAHRPSAIWSTSPLPSAHLLGMWAQRTFGLPWIADFRDPWSLHEIYPYYPGYQALNRRMEKRVLARASRVVTVSEPIAEMLRELSGRAADDVIVIENGYDETDVAMLPPPHTDRFTIAYTGEFSRVTRPTHFVAGIRMLLAQGEIPRDEIRVVFAGKDTGRFIPDEPPFEQAGYLHHSELNALRNRTDLLLLVLGEPARGKGTYSGKLFEYLASNRPTLVVAHPDNVAAQLIRRARAGTVARNDPSEIAAAVLEHYRAWKSGRFDHAPDWDVIRGFTRRNLARRLAAALDELEARA